MNLSPGIVNHNLGELAIAQHAFTDLFLKVAARDSSTEKRLCGLRSPTRRPSSRVAISIGSTKSESFERTTATS